jgi:signal transduction histidine kinase
VKVIRSGVFLLLSAALGWIGALALIVALFGGVATAVIWVGIPVLAITMWLWRGMATVQRRLGRLVGTPIDMPYRPLPDGGWLKRWRRRATDRATWRDLLWFLPVAPVLSLFWFLVNVVLWGNGLLLSTAWIWYRWLKRSDQQFTDFGDWRLVVHTTQQGLVWVPAGVAALILGYFVTRGTAKAHAITARALLGPTRQAEVYARTETLVETRARAVSAAEEERRRIERDLHDSTQQQLVSLAMDLGRAREKLATDPAGAEQLLAKAHEESKRAISDLRDLVRGIHPAVLTDRGLDAALSALAGRSPVPVEVQSKLVDRVGEQAEAVAYFVVAEALTNIAKHAGATRAWVRLEQLGRHLIVEIRDDGRGGAVATKGGGLAGLKDRAAAIDGTVEINSPPGAGTLIRLELPCGS